MKWQGKSQALFLISSLILSMKKKQIRANKIGAITKILKNAPGSALIKNSLNLVMPSTLPCSQLGMITK